jgi:hypothetical protein
MSIIFSLLLLHGVDVKLHCHVIIAEGMNVKTGGATSDRLEVHFEDEVFVTTHVTMNRSM